MAAFADIDLDQHKIDAVGAVENDVTGFGSPLTELSSLSSEND